MTALARDHAGVTPTIRGKLPTKNGRLYIGLGDWQKHRNKRQDPSGTGTRNYFQIKCLNTVFHSWDWLEGNKTEAHCFFFFFFYLCFLFSSQIHTQLLFAFREPNIVNKHDHEICQKAWWKNNTKAPSTSTSFRDLAYPLQSSRKYLSITTAQLRPKSVVILFCFVFVLVFHDPPSLRRAHIHLDLTPYRKWRKHQDPGIFRDFQTHTHMWENLVAVGMLTSRIGQIIKHGTCISFTDSWIKINALH